MTIEINDLEAVLPFDLKTRVFFLRGTRVSEGRIRRIKTEVYGRTGHKNVHITLHAVIVSGGKEYELPFGCFGRTEAAARQSSESRVIAMHAISGGSYPPSKHPWKRRKEGEWRP